MNWRGFAVYVSACFGSLFAHKRADMDKQKTPPSGAQSSRDARGRDSAGRSETVDREVILLCRGMNGELRGRLSSLLRGVEDGKRHMHYFQCSFSAQEP